MLFLRDRIAANRNLVGDLIGILLLLAAGISGQLLLSDPLRFLFRASELPMLSPEDWPSSQISRELSIIGGHPWSHQRKFGQDMVLIKNNMTMEEVDHYIVWYSDLTQAETDWKLYQRLPTSDFQVIVSSTDKNKPESVLFCLTPGIQIPHECYYHAYWEHWFTEVYFYGRTDEDLPFSEMQTLMDRTDQLLMSAPDKPCQWLSCTGTAEVGK
jgi:hypothetical protein